MEFQEKVQGLDQMRSLLKEKEKQEIEGKMEDDKGKLQPMAKNLAELSVKREKLKKEAVAKHNSIQPGINIFRDNQKEIDRQNKEIQTYEELNLERKFMETEKKISEANENLKKVQEKKANTN
jgi:hypothetical protein